MWDTQSISPEIEFPLPRTWLDEATVENGWQVFRPEENSLTSASFLLEDTAEVDVMGMLDIFVPDATNIQEQTFVGVSATWDTVEYSVTVNETALTGADLSDRSE